MVRVAIVGIGGYGWSLIRALKQASQDRPYRLIAAADTRLGKFADQVAELKADGVRVFDDGGKRGHSTFSAKGKQVSALLWASAAHEDGCDLAPAFRPTAIGPIVSHFSCIGSGSRIASYPSLPQRGRPSAVTPGCVPGEPGALPRS